MLKKFISLFLCLIAVGNLPLLASPKQSREEKLKAQISGWGIGKRITVNLKTGEAIDGSIGEIKETIFTLQSIKDGKIENREISYTDITKLSEKATGQKAGKIPGRVSIGVVIGVIVVAAVAAAAYIKNDRGIK
jgi:hypothetical protein